MRHALYIAARAPRPGFTKTRLGRVIGHENAARLYRAFLSDLAERFSTAPFNVGWFVTPPDAWLEIARDVRIANRQQRIICQPDGDWATRQRTLFASMYQRDEDRTILIASDSPQIPVEAVCSAFHLLDRNDLVLGPVFDGGYYLIGMRGAATSRLLDGVPMSNSTVLDRLIARADQLDYSVGLTEPTFDVDEVADLETLRVHAELRDDLGATRAVLRELSLPLRDESAHEPVMAGSEANR